MNRFSPVMRISWGLVMVTCSLLLTLDLVGMIPRASHEAVESRIRLCETLASQVALAAERNDLASVRAAVQVAVRRNEDVLSAGLRAESGRLLVTTGNHRALWDPKRPEGSSASHVRMPLYRSGKPWATLEVRFENLAPGGWIPTLWGNPLLRLVLSMGVGGFLAYLLYMRRTLRHLDPSAVVPTRVQTALDVMAEGVLLLDQEERIVLANSSFAEKSGRSPARLIGIKASSLEWRAPRGDERPRRLPWLETIRQSQTFGSSRLCLAGDSGGAHSFVVKSAPVLDGFGRAKGAIVTFDDVTELERKRAELEETLAKLEKSREEIRLQNEELQILARRDPLTGVANRRAFLERFEGLFVASKESGRRLSFLMVDIDHFKRINDEHGHQAGDEVIQRVSEALAEAVRSSDAVCRYGGEEFCIVLPETPPEGAVLVAERLREKIASPGFARVPVSASFGVASVAFGAVSSAELINQADEALYASKEAGRNRVTRWDQIERAVQ